MDSGWPQRSEMAKVSCIASLVTTGKQAMSPRLGLLALAATGFALLSGCVAQQADLKQTERELQLQPVCARGIAGADPELRQPHLGQPGRERQRLP